jgi:putative ABC transport system permease protein
MANYITLNYLDLALASVLVLIDAGLSIIFGLKIHRSLLIAAIRMAVQLTFVGLVLTALFSLVSPVWTGLAVLTMILLAGQEVMQRQDRRLSGWWVLWARHRLHDDVFGSGDRLCPPDRNPTEPVV